MLKLLLSECPSRKQDTLLHLIPWQELGFEVFTANFCAPSFFSDVAALKPDALLADIHDSFEDWVGIICHARELCANLHVVLMNESWPFDVLKTAMQTNADDYLLQTASVDEVCEALQRVHDRCRKERENERLQKGILSSGVAQQLTGFGPSLLGQVNLATLIATYFDREHLPDSQYYLALISVGEFRYIIQNQDILNFTVSDVMEEIQRAGEFLPCMLVSLPSHEFAMISPDDPSNALQQWWNQGGDTKEFINVVYKNTPMPPVEMKSALREFQILRNHLTLMYGSGRIHEYQEAEKMGGTLIPAHVFSFDVGTLVQAIASNQAKVMQRELQSFFQENICDNIHMLTVELVDQIDRALYNSSIPSSFSSRRKSMLIKRLLDVESAGMLHQMMQTYLDDLASSIASGENHYHERIVQSAIEYIHQHCGEPFTIEQLAETMHYSPNHLRYVFKHVTGHTLSEEISTIRMNQARRLLEETMLRVHEISRQVGYINPSYFISQFIKKYGVTPAQYRYLYDR